MNGNVQDSELAKKKLTEFLKVVVSGLIEKKDSLSIEITETKLHAKGDSETEGERVLLTFKLRVAEDETGRIIGKRGRIANSLRILFKSAAQFYNVTAALDID